MLSLHSSASAQEQSGSIRGVVHDKDFDVPLAEAVVLTVETGQKVTTTDQGNYVFSLVPPGKTLTSGYLWLGTPARKVRALTQNELDWLTYSATHYIELKNKYLRRP